jgi:kinesin family member 5
LGTLRFGIRAKSIKNSARVNAELSPAELKNMLKKSQAANATYQAYIAALEAELGVWRSGGQVDQGDWATPDKAASGSTAIKRPASTTPSTPGRSMTPIIPALQDLRDLDSRPQTPTVVGLDKDERDDFLRRENELSDLLAEKVRFRVDFVSNLLTPCNRKPL